MDPRITKLADLMVNYSNKVSRGDLVQIGGPVVTMPLMQAVYEKCIEAGANPFCEFEASWMQETLLKKGRKKQIDFLPPWKTDQIEAVDCLFRFLGETNTRALSGVDPKKQQQRLKAMKPVRDIMHRRMDDESIRWCLTLFPTEAYAQDADMSLSDFEDFVYKACKVDQKDPIAAWKKVRREQEKMVNYLTGKKKIRIVGKETDITFEVRDRTWINCCGTENMPDGEVFTGPVEDSANGTILFSFPACYNGREVENVHMTFKEGKVVKATATKNEAFLNELLDMDAGARFLGEFSFATNRGIQQYIKNILFDEKIGGTVHFAVGSSYGESGGKNKSTLHWDMVCDLRQGGKAYVDGKVFLRDGEFVAGV
ncbi:MAG: aminopeptidase [Candidatus Omnitrophica bacterium]|nr:aminopeptidase [Candidatus Omnitrophota bacterium]